MNLTISCVKVPLPLIGQKRYNVIYRNEGSGPSKFLEHHNRLDAVTNEYTP